MQTRTLVRLGQVKVLVVPEWSNAYIAVNGGGAYVLDIQELADRVNVYSGLAPDGPLFRAGESRREHRSLILLACSARPPLEWLDSCQQETP